MVLKKFQYSLNCYSCQGNGGYGFCHKVIDTATITHLSFFWWNSYLGECVFLLTPCAGFLKSPHSKDDEKTQTRLWHPSTRQQHPLNFSPRSFSLSEARKTLKTFRGSHSRGGFSFQESLSVESKSQSAQPAAIAFTLYLLQFLKLGCYTMAGLRLWSYKCFFFNH